MSREVTFIETQGRFADVQAGGWYADHLLVGTRELLGEMKTFYNWLVVVVHPL